MLTVCIGYDPRETVAWHVLCHSILKRATRPVKIVPLALGSLVREYKRPYPLHEGASTEFAFSRFMTPWLAGGGVSVFMDCDMLCLTDISQLEDIAKEQLYRDVLVVKHDYKTIAKSKFLNAENLDYPCKNWSSVMVFNGWRTACRNLTPDKVNSLTPLQLHQFQWTKDVGELGKEWNHLVGEYPPNPDAKIVHFTLGTPCFDEYKDCEYADKWRREKRDMLYHYGKQR